MSLALCPASAPALLRTGMSVHGSQGCGQAQPLPSQDRQAPRLDREAGEGSSGKASSPAGAAWAVRACRGGRDVWGVLASELRDRNRLGPTSPIWIGRDCGGLSFWLPGPLELMGWCAPPPCLSFSRCRRRDAGPTVARLVPQLRGVLRLGGTCPFPRDLPCSPSPSCTSPYYAPTVCRALSAWGQR